VNSAAGVANFDLREKLSLTGDKTYKFTGKTSDSKRS